MLKITAQHTRQGVLFCILLLVCLGTVLVTRTASAQSTPEIEIPLTVTTDAGNSKTLTFGLDPSATDGIDPDFGEVEQPPPPPSTAFDVRWIDDDISVSGFGEGLTVDIRPRSASFLRGTKVHELRQQPGTDTQRLTFAWNLPDGVTGVMTDLLTEGDLVQAPMSGEGSFTLTNMNVSKLIVTVDYGPPETSDDAYRTPEDQTLEISDPSRGVLANDTGSGSGPVTAEVETTVSNGTLTLNSDGTFSYAPNENFSGEDRFTYVAVQGNGRSDPSTVTIAILPVNDAPSVTLDGDLSVEEDAPAQRIADFARFDPGPSNESNQQIDTYLVEVEEGADTLFASGPALTSDGTLTFESAPDAHGQATVTVRVQDDGGTDRGGENTSSPQTFTITITPVNDAPTVTQPLPDLPDLKEDGPDQILDLAPVFSDVEDDMSALTFVVDNTNPSLVRATIDDESARLTLRLQPEQHGTATITVKATDTEGATGTDAFSLTVDPVDDPPSIADLPDQSVDEDETIGPISFSIEDPETPASRLSLSASSDNSALIPPENLQLGGSGSNRTLEVRPAADQHGTATISLTVDDAGLEKAVATTTFGVTIRSVNDAPSVTLDGDLSVEEDAPTQRIADFARFDPGPSNESNQQIDTYLVEVEEGADTLFASGPALTSDGTLTFESAPDAHGQATVTVRVQDDGGTDRGGEDTSPPETFTITITPVNDAPVAKGTIPDLTLRVTDPPLELTELRRTIFADPEDDPLSLTARSEDTTVVSAATKRGSVFLTPEGPGSAQVIVTASDGSAQKAAPSFPVTVKQGSSDPAEPASKSAAAVIRSSKGPDLSVDLGDTGTIVTLRNVQDDGFLQMRFFQDPGTSSAKAKAAPEDSFETLSPYRWVGETDVLFASADVRFRLDDEDVRGVDDPTTVTVLHDENGDGTFVSSPTVFDHGGTPGDPSDDVLIAQDLARLGTFRFASDTNPLPVELADFTAQLDGEAVLLEWTTASETNNAGFEVERRAEDDDTFEPLHFVDGQGTTPDLQHYRFVDSSLPFGVETLIYRLTQVDLDGSTSHSSPFRIRIAVGTQAKLLAPFPNPARTHATLRYAVPTAAPAQIQVYNLLGQRVVSVDLPPRAGRAEARFHTGQWPAGLYFVRLIAGAEIRTQRLTVVQ